MKKYLLYLSPTIFLVVLIIITHKLQPRIITYIGFDQFEYLFAVSPGLMPEPSWVFSLFTHGNILHLSANILSLSIYGLALERYLDWKPYLSVYFTSGILAGIIHTNLTQSTGIGASGAVMGIIAFYFIICFFEYRPDRWNSIKNELFRMEFVERSSFILAMLGPPAIVVQTVIDFFIVVDTGLIVHISGAIVGGILGVIYISYERNGYVDNITRYINKHPFEVFVFTLLVVLALTLGYFLISITRAEGVTPATVQSLATIILVLVTIWYGYNTKRNVDLFRKELELESKRYHADILQGRIEEWLDNFPSVQETEIPTFQEKNKGENVAVPDSLQSDPYFEDLIENHACDLQDHIDKIQEKYTEFRGIQEEFIKNFDTSSIYRKHRMPYTEIIDENYARWLFECILLLERTEKDVDDLKSEVSEAFTDSFVEGDNRYDLHGDTDKSNRIMIYKKRNPYRPEDRIGRKVRAQIPIDSIENIKSINGYQDVLYAAELLDEIERELDRLEQKLIEYSEYDYFEGDCELVSEPV